MGLGLGLGTVEGIDLVARATAPRYISSYLPISPHISLHLVARATAPYDGIRNRPRVGGVVG